jgi:hypothetical protein
MIARRVYPVAVGLLAVSAGVLFAAVLVAAGIRWPTASVVPSDSPTPSGSGAVHALMAVPIPADADCSACHIGGGTASIRDIPAMAHAVEGWRNCIACHSDDSLVPTAPGHTGIGKQLCLACHEAAAPGASALPRPHHVVAGTSCVTCHGSEAPLPTDMAGRNNCWICHPDADSEALFGTPGP